MASAKIVNLSQYVGENKNYQDTIYQADGVTPQDITGWTITFTVHEYGNPSNVYVTKTCSHVNDPGGVCNANVAEADTSGMLPGEYEHVWERTDAAHDGVPTAGDFTLRRK